MPDTQTSELPAGRDLDARVAVIMGLKVFEWDAPCDRSTPGVVWDFGQDGYAVNMTCICPPDVDEETCGEDEDNPLVELPRYSTEIAAAWPVFEWLCDQCAAVQDHALRIGRTVEHGMDCELGRHVVTWPKERAGDLEWHVYYSYALTEETVIYLAVQGDTAPLAICRLAVKVAGLLDKEKG